MESLHPQPEPEPCAVIGMEVLRAWRNARLNEIENTKAALAPAPMAPLLHVIQPHETPQTRYELTYIDDHSY